MSNLTIINWCSGDPCDPCAKPVLPGGGGPPPTPPSGILPGPIYDGAVTINQFQIVTGSYGDPLKLFIGRMTITTFHQNIYSSLETVVSGHFGTPPIWQPPYITVIIYESSVIITHPAYTPDTYPLTTFTTEPLSSGGTDPAGDASANTAAQQDAINQAYTTLGLEPPPALP